MKRRLDPRPRRAAPLLAAALLSLGALAACGGGGGGGGGKAEGGGGGGGGKPKGPLVVRVLEVHPERVERTVELTGTLGGDEEVTLAAEVEGRVVKIEADLGDAVKQGAPVVRLADEELRLRVQQAEADYLVSLAKLGVDDAGLASYDPQSWAGVKRADADLDEAKRTFERVDALHKKNLASDGERDQARTRLAVAEAAAQAAREEARSAFATAMARKAALGLAKKKLRDASISSPVAGLVARRSVALGEYVKPGQAVATVVVQSPLKLRGEVPERYAGLLAPGMAVTMHVDAIGAKAEGTISRVGPAVQSGTRTFPVEALVDNAAGALKPGLFARASIVVGQDEEVIAVPDTAVSAVAGVTKVFVEEDGKAAERRVQVLRKRGDQALLAGELKEGDRVILTAIARLFPGAEVKVDGKAPAAEALPSGAPPREAAPASSKAAGG